MNLITLDKISKSYSEKVLLDNVTLNINNKELTLKDVNEYIEIDTELKETFKDNVSKNDKKVGEYPNFMIGENTISWTGNVTKIEIEPKWRFL